MHNNNQAFCDFAAIKNEIRHMAMLCSLPDHLFYLVYCRQLTGNHVFSNPPRKIIVLISHLLSDAHRYILRCLSNHGTVSHCTVLTAISEVLNPCKSMMCVV
jgi:hypothetical protein